MMTVEFVAVDGLERPRTGKAAMVVGAGAGAVAAASGLASDYECGCVMIG